MLIPTTDFQVTAPALLFDPEFYIFDFSPDFKDTKFLVVEEKNLRLAPFIDIRFEPLAQGQFSIPTKELFALEKMHNIKRPQSTFIFHHAFVCSTLLARCLNQIDAFFSLKEPWILRRLSDLKRSQRNTFLEKEWQEIFCCYLGLLAKNYRSGKTPVIKVTNVANNLLEDVLEYLPDQKILYLYSDLKSFLVSNLKKPQETQIKMPGLASSFLMDSDFARKYPQFCEIKKLSFLQICSLIWVVNLYNFKSCSQDYNTQNIKTLDMKKFLANMGDNLESLSRFFGNEPNPTEIGKMLDPSVTKTDAKHQHIQYGNDKKQAESTAIMEKYGIEIANTQLWLSPLIEELDIIQYCENKNL